MTKIEIARKARECAEWVRGHGFVKFTRHDGGDGYCALGVMEKVTGLVPWEMVEHKFPEFTQAVARPLGAPARVPYGDVAAYAAHVIADWNNASDRTAQDLIDHFEGVALQLDIEALAEKAKAIPEEVLA